MATNYITNPSVETDLTGYTTNGSATNTREPGDANSTGLYCIETIADATAGFGLVGYFPTPALAQVTLSFDVWLASDAGDWKVTMYGFDAANSFVEVLAVNQPFTAGAKQRVGFTVTPVNAATVNMQFEITRASAAVGTIRTDAFRIAPGTDATWPTNNPYARIRRQFELRPY